MTIDAETAVRTMRRVRTSEARRTEECLRATCMFRALFTRRRGRPPHLDECPTTCPYHAVHVRPTVTEFAGRTFHSGRDGE